MSLGCYFEVAEHSFADGDGRGFPHSLGPFELRQTEGIAPADLRIDWGPVATWAVQERQCSLARSALRAPATQLAPALPEVLEIALSPLYPVNLSHEARRAAQIPDDAEHFVWCYPARLDWSVVAPEVADQAAADAALLRTGGFVYFGRGLRALRINSLLPSEGGAGALRFGRPREWLPGWTESLVAQKRTFHPVTLQNLDVGGAAYFAWIPPYTYVGGSTSEPGSFCPDGTPICFLGGFAYLFRTLEEQIQVEQAIVVRPSETWLVLYHHSMRHIALQVKELLGLRVQLSEMEWTRFNDGFPNLKLDGTDASRLEDFHGTVFIGSFHSPDVIFEQMCLLYQLPKLHAKNLRIILPWFSTGTMERVESLGQIATAASLAHMLSNVPRGPSGPPTVIIYDIHALQEQFYFRDSILVDLQSAVSLLLRAIEACRAEAPGEDIAIAFPDDGAHKRFKAKFSGFPLIICDKVRDGDRRIVKVKEGEAAGKHCVIVDDLVQSGGTLLECAKPLREMGATKVSCFCTHGVFPKESYNKFVGNDLIHRFWITDSIPTTAAAVEGKSPFEVLSLAPLIGSYLSSALLD